MEAGHDPPGSDVASLEQASVPETLKATPTTEPERNEPRDTDNNIPNYDQLTTNGFPNVPPAASHDVKDLHATENNDFPTNTKAAGATPPAQNTKEDASKHSKSPGSNLELKQAPYDKKRRGWFHMLLSWRFVMAVMLHLSIVMNSQPFRLMPITLVCMTDPVTSPARPNLTVVNTNFTGQASYTGNMTSFESNDALMSRSRKTFDEIQGSGKEFQWDAQIQGLVLTSFYMTSFSGPLLGDFTRQYLGSKWTVTLFMTFSAFLTLISPVAARTGPYYLIAVRIIQGTTSSVNTPVIGDALAWWAPQAERSTLAAVSYSGFTMSGLFVNIIAGYLCSVSIDNGWPFVFYFFGSVTVVWTLAWVLMISRKPEEHRFISEQEKTYITTHRRGMGPHVKRQKKDRPPYKPVLTSGPVLALLFAFTCNIWITHAVVSLSPIYFNKVLNINVETIGVILSFASVAKFIGSLCWSASSNALLTMRGMTTAKSKKICTVTGLVGGGAFTICLAFLDEDAKWPAIALYTLAMIMQSVGSGIVLSVPLDMAPRYAGFLTSVLFCVVNIVGVSAPLTISTLTSTNTDQEWKFAWILIGGVFVSGGLVFAIFGQASLQPWAIPKELPEVSTKLLPPEHPQVTNSDAIRAKEAGQTGPKDGSGSGGGGGGGDSER